MLYFLVVSIVAISILVPLFLLKLLLQNKRLENLQVVGNSNPPVAFLFADEGAIWEVKSSGSDNIQISSDIWPGEY